jgi:hypothetical protein
LVPVQYWSSNNYELGHCSSSLYRTKFLYYVS